MAGTGYPGKKTIVGGASVERAQHEAAVKADEAETNAATYTQSAISGHEGKVDPHSVYQKESEKDQASGYAGIGAGGKQVKAQHEELLNLADLLDVTIGTPADNEALIWDAASSRWINEAPAGGGVGVGIPAKAAKAVRTSSVQSITNNTWTVITFDTERFDTDSFYDPGTPTKITIPSGAAGRYLVVARGDFAFHATGDRHIQARLNGTDNVAGAAQRAGASFDTRITSVGVVDLVAGDYLELLVFQNSGGSLNAGTVGVDDLALTVVSLAAAAPTFVGARAYLASAATQSLANNTEAAISLTSEEYDTSTFHSTATNTSRMTVPAGGDGYYRITASIRYAGNATGIRSCRIRKNGTTRIGFSNIKAADAGDVTVINSTVTHYLAAGDYVEMVGLQASGGALDVTGDISGVYLELVREGV